MPIPETLLNQMRCCLYDDGHIVDEPLLFSCGFNACKKCINDSTVTTIKCFGCNGEHEKSVLLTAPNNKFVESFIQSFLPDLFQDLRTKLQSIDDLLKGLTFILKRIKMFNFLFLYIEESIIDDLQLKTENIEFEIDIRVESLISEIHSYRDNFMTQLQKYRQDFEKYVTFII
jgi:hypothetical protein